VPVSLAGARGKGVSLSLERRAANRRPGLPPGSAKRAVKTVRGRIESAGRRAESGPAFDALANMPDGTATPTNYGWRRHALRNWVISPAGGAS
jgi:hypothetical protein